MDTTRRDFVGIGAAAAAVASTGAHAATAKGAKADVNKPYAGKHDALYVAAYGPVDSNLKWDHGAFDEMLAYWKANGADGALVLGSTGEGQSFSMAERKAVIERVGKNKHGLEIIVATGTPNFPDTIELSKHAADHGADCSLIVPPFYAPKPSGDGVLAYFDKVFAQVKTPVRYYHIESWTGVPVTDMKVWSTLAQNSQFVGVKYTGRDPKEYENIAAQMPTKTVHTGTDGNVELSLSHGNGAILASANIFTRQWAEVWKAKRAGQDIKPLMAKVQAAQALFKQEGYGKGTAADKYALSVLLGSRQTFSRPPELNNVSDAEKANIRNAVAQLKAMA